MNERSNLYFILHILFLFKVKSIIIQGLETLEISMACIKYSVISSDIHVPVQWNGCITCRVFRGGG